MTYTVSYRITMKSGLYTFHAEVDADSGKEAREKVREELYRLTGRTGTHYRFRLGKVWKDTPNHGYPPAKTGWSPTF